MSEIEEINYIKYTLEHYSGDINDLEWSTSQILNLLSSLKKVQKQRDDFKELYEVERETCNRWIDKYEKVEEKVKELTGFVEFLDKRAIEGKKLWWASFKDVKVPPTQEPSLEELFCWLVDQVKSLEEMKEAK